jgi:hypothetical protein
MGSKSSEVKITGDSRSYENAVKKAEQADAAWSAGAEKTAAKAAASSAAFAKLEKSIVAAAAAEAKAAAASGANAAKNAGAGGYEAVRAKAKIATDQANAFTKAASSAAAAVAKVGDASSGVEKAGSALASAIGPAGGLLGKLGSFGMAGMAVQQAAAAIGELVQQLDAAAEKAYENETASRNLQVSLDGARVATRGMVSDLDLARISSKAFSMGVIEDGDDFATFAAGVTAKAEVMGRSTTELMDEMTTAVGRGSLLILDNAGIVMTKAKAEQMLASKLGKTVETLTEYEKSTAVAEAALIELGKAAEDAVTANDSLATSWKEGKIALENYRNGVFGFTADAGRVREVLRKLDADTLDAFGSRKQEDVNKVNLALKEYGLTLEDVKAVANELGNVEEMRGGQLDYDNRKKQETELNKLAGEALRFQERKAAKMQEQNDLAEKEAKAKSLVAEAETLDHQAALLGLQKNTEGEILMLQVQALDLRKQSAEVEGDTAKALEHQRAIELALAKPLKDKKTGGTKLVELRKMEAELAQNELEFAIELARLDKAGATSAMARAIDTAKIVELERELLDLRGRQVEAMPEATRKQALEKAAAAFELEADFERQRRAELELTREAEREASEERIAELDREIERSAALGADVRLLAELRRQAEVDQVTRFGTVEERRQVEHDAEVSRIEERQTWAEQAASDELTRHQRSIELLEAQGIGTQELFDRKVELELRLADVQRNAAARAEVLHRAELTRIKMRLDAQRRAIQAANTAMGTAAEFGKTIIDAAIRDDAKRERAQLRMAGVMAIARAAVETVEAAAAFARYDFIGGALHTAAAALGYVQGGIMLAGRLPSQGGGSSSVGGGGSGSDTSSSSSSGSSGREPPAVPLSQDLDDARGNRTAAGKANAGEKQGNVIVINGPVITQDSSFMLGQVEERRKAGWG